MKPFKTLGGLVLTTSALVLATSCTKTLEETNLKDNSSLSTRTEQFIPCGTAIELQMRQGTAENFFWLGDKTDPAARQNFSGTNFSESKYFDVISNVGTPFHKMGNGAMGVKNDANPSDIDYSIDAGEELWLTLSATNLPNYKLSGFDVILHAANTLVGRIELYDGMTLRETINITGPQATSKNFGVSFQTDGGLEPAELKFFNQVRFISTSGTFHILGFQPNRNPNLLKPGKFFLAELSNAIYLRNTNLPAGSAFGYKNQYINKGLFARDENPTTDRQYRAQLANDLAGSGEYNVLNPDKWLKISSTGGSLTFTDIGFRLAVGQFPVMNLNNNRSIQPGESIVIEPGTDFPLGYFGAFEFREASIAGVNDKLLVEMYDGMTMVASGETKGIDNSYNFFASGAKFNKIVIKGKNSTGLGSIGRNGNQIISAYPACSN